MPTTTRKRAVCSAEVLKGKRVAMVTFSAYPADPRPRRAVSALLSQGVAVDLICIGEGPVAEDALPGLNLRRLGVTHRRGGKLAYAYQYLAFLTLATGILAARTVRRRYDLVWVHNMPDILVISALIPRALGAKVVLDLHDPMPELMITLFQLQASSFLVKLMRRLERWSVGRADLVLTVNVACKRLFGSRSCPPEKIGVVMNSPDGDIFPSRPPAGPTPFESDRPFVLMYHGLPVQRNGLDLAIEAIVRLREELPQLQLRVYGRPTPFLETMRERTQTLGLQDCVTFLGQKSLEELVHEIERCDAGVIPNNQNAFTEINTPTRIFEYLALGKPVIAPRTRGIQDYFSEDCLYYFEAGDVDDLARAICNLYSYRERGLQVAKSGYDVYLSHTWTQEKERLLQLLNNLLDNRTQSAPRQCYSEAERP